jgi:hypothetical protein
MVMYQGNPSISVHLTGYDGIHPGGAARVLSPAFNITLRLMQRSSASECWPCKVPFEAFFFYFVWLCTLTPS